MVTKVVGLQKRVFWYAVFSVLTLGSSCDPTNGTGNQATDRTPLLRHFETENWIFRPKFSGITTHPRMLTVQSHDGTVEVQLFCRNDGSVYARDIRVWGKDGQLSFIVQEIWVIGGEATCDSGPCHRFEAPPVWSCTFFNTDGIRPQNREDLFRHLNRIYRQSNEVKD